jgi:hypothetical protein
MALAARATGAARLEVGAGGGQAAGPRKLDACSQAVRARLQTQVASVLKRDGAGDGQTEADAPGIQISRGVGALERFENPCHLTFGDPRTVVRDVDDRVPSLVTHRDFGAPSVLNCVVDQICEQSFEGRLD